MFTLLIFTSLGLSGLTYILHHQRIAGNLFLISLLIFWLSGSSLVPYLFTQSLQSDYPTYSTVNWKEHNTIVLLGGGTFKNAEDNQITPRPLSYSRIYETARLYETCQKAGKECSIIISGGDVTEDGMTEAESYKKALLELNVVNADIITETESMNTWENAKNVSKILRGQRTNKTVLVTSGIHMKRALLYFNNFNINPTPSASDYLKPIASLAPVGYNLALSDQTVHEYLGMVQYYVQHGQLLTFNKRQAYSYAAL